MKRLQRKRVNGWRMPENSIYVGRPTIYGNPFKFGMVFTEADIIYGSLNHQITIHLVGKPLTAQDCVNLYKHLMTDTHFGVLLINKWRSELAGHDLACWCKEGEPCHADVLIELLNK